MRTLATLLATTAVALVLQACNSDSNQQTTQQPTGQTPTQQQNQPVPTAYGNYPDTLQVNNQAGAQMRAWFDSAKLGVFIHYVDKASDALLNPDSLQNLSFSEKAKLRASKFDAAQYDPTKWAKQFKKWGADYAVLTTKHHIGFALFDGAGSQHSVMTASPAKRDLVKPFVEAMRAEGIKVGLYYSLPDWMHPHYATLTHKPKKGKTANKDERAYAAKDDTARWNKFVKQMHAEVRHLMTNYGKIDLLWFDGDWERRAEEWHSYELQKMVQKLQPGIVINNRLRHQSLGHYGTPEQIVPLAPRSEANWELCFTPGDNWDGPDANKNLKPPHELVRIFADVVTLGGKWLVNVAPGPHGQLAKPQTDRLDTVAQWINQNKEAFYATEKGLPWGLFNGGSTIKGNNLYLIAYDAPRPELVVKGIEAPIKQVTHLISGDTLTYRYSGGYKGWNRKGWLYVNLPQKYVGPYATVVKITYATDSVQIAQPDGSVRWMVKK